MNGMTRESLRSPVLSDLGAMFSPGKQKEAI